MAWWQQLTAAGGEGMVVKPLDFVVRGRRGLAQPAVNHRGREYLRIIGPAAAAAAEERRSARGPARTWTTDAADSSHRPAG